jgi:hypothetical protein
MDQGILRRALELKSKGRKLMARRRIRWFCHVLEDIKKRERAGKNKKRKDCGKTEGIGEVWFINVYKTNDARRRRRRKQLYSVVSTSDLNGHSPKHG